MAKSISLVLVLLVLVAYFPQVLPAATLRDRFDAFITAEDDRAGQDDATLRKYHECLSCHDGTVASDVSVSSARKGKRMGWTSAGQNHPVGVTYESSVLHDKGRLNNVSSLPSEIVLLKGQVTCLSCHKLKEDSEKAGSDEFGTGSQRANCTSSKSLTMGSNKDDLCLACHNI